KERFPDKLFSTIIHVNVKLKESQNKGIHILSYDKYSRGAKDYFSLSRELITQEVSFAMNIEEADAALNREFARLSEIALSIDAPEARDVFLAGDFNSWQLNNRTRMELNDGKKWVKNLRLKPGSYRYRFVVDGKWRQDPGNPNYKLNPFGSMDSLLEVKEA
ncbi:MAG: glycogen-binding domain-containing protein, partial [Candidatus Omnitrophota bacterium]